MPLAKPIWEPMACYYLIISSTHLSNGHFRSIKGVFKGPLRKTDTSLPGYAEKGKSIENALEDLNANFYCELCDKQYHKHKEFDNHINSYDHAHKQRLKELKQREFARNVASKSWKGEKKQEKALKRLLQVADLRKQQDCVSDKGPVFKAPRLGETQPSFLESKDGRTSNSSCTVVCKGEPVSSSAIAENKEDILLGGDIKNKSRCCSTGNQTQLSFSNNTNVNNRAGVSFCFSKKALQKLDSSASVFNESPDDPNDCSEFFNHKAKQMSASFRNYVQMNEHAEENGALAFQHETDEFHGTKPADNESFKDDNNDDGTNKTLAEEQNEIDQSNINAQLQLSNGGCIETCNEKEKVYASQRSDETSESSGAMDCSTKSNTQHNYSSKHTVSEAKLIDHLSEIVSQNFSDDEVISSQNSQSLEDPNNEEKNCVSSIQYFDSSIRSTQSPIKSTDSASSDSMNGSAENVSSCLSVLSKDGSTNLQWPRELLLFTKTEPSISYACNPLYFDFKCSRKPAVKVTHEPISKTFEVQEHLKHTNEKDTSSDSSFIDLHCGHPSKPKREKLGLNKVFGTAPKSFCKVKRKNTQKRQHYHEAPDVTRHSSTGKLVKEVHYSRKRKRSVQSWLETSEESLYKNGENDSVLKENDEKKSFKSSHVNPLYVTDKNEHLDWQNKNHKCKNNGFSQIENEFMWDSVNEKDSSSNRALNLEYGTHSEASPYQTSSSSNAIMCWDSSKNDGLTHTHKNLSIITKHNFCRSSEDDKYLSSGESDREQVYQCRKLKHKSSKHISRHQCLYHTLCCEHVKTQHCSKVFTKDYISDRLHESQTNSIKNIMSPNPSIPEESKDLLSAQTNCDNTEGEELTHERKPPNRTLENIVGQITAEETNTLVSKVVLENGHSANQEANNIINTKNSSMEINEKSQSYIAVNFPSPVEETTLSPHITNCVNVQEKKSKYNKREGSEAKVISNDDNCLLQDKIHIGSECQFLNSDITNNLVEQSKQSGEVKPFMQSSDQVDLNLSQALPSLQHSGAINSPKTKEEYNRLGQHNVNIKSIPVDVNMKCCYDNFTMQDINKTENHPRVCHKTTSLPLTQQPITFSPEEVDKYRHLQLQAQQHVQKQLFSKHFKGLTSMGSAVFATANTIQPVSVHHHPSVTTIHHTLMHRYAVTASMHSPVHHFPLQHLNPFPQPHFTPIALSSLTPTPFPTQPTFLASHPLHFISTTIHPPQLNFQAIPHTSLIPTLLAPHPNAGLHPTIHVHPLIHPLFQGHDYHHITGTSQTH